MPGESYADLAKPKKPPSLSRSILLAMLMLFGVFLMAPLMDMLSPQKSKVSLTDDVEIPEPDVVPELPEVEPLLPPLEEEPLPEMDRVAPEPVRVAGNTGLSLQFGSGSSGLLDPVGEIAGLSDGPLPLEVGFPVLAERERVRIHTELANSGLTFPVRVEIRVGANGQVDQVSLVDETNLNSFQRIQEIMTNLRVNESFWGSQQVLVWE